MTYRLFLLALALTLTSFLHPQVASAESPPPYSLPSSDEGLPGVGVIRRADWFQNVWNQRRSSWLDKTAADTGAVIFLGDSITQGWEDLLERKFSPMKVANRGISGDTTRGMLLRLTDDVLAVKPAAVVLLAGTNDLEEKMTPEAIASNMKLLLEALKAHRPDMPVILCKVFPSAAAKSRSMADIKELNRRYAALVLDQPQVTLLETWKPFATAEGDAIPAEFPDLLHPNALGYAKWAAALRPVLATLGLLEKEPDAFVPEEGFTALFNGRDLTGWALKDAAAEDGKVRSQDGRYLASHGCLVVTTPSEGSKLAQLYTVRQFAKDFTLRLDFRATPDADSGVFIRGPQLQCRDYILAGPYKNLAHYKPQDWNSIEVTVTGNTARCTCNGEVLEEAFALPPSGPIGLEGDRGQMEYRRIRIKE